jgi:hypothetical protein
MKRLWILLAVLCVGLWTSEACGECTDYGGDACPTFKRGDVDEDLDVDADDVTSFYAKCTRVSPPPDYPDAMDACDVDDDGDIDSADGVYLATYWYSSGPEPARPFDDEALDLTSDDLDASCTGIGDRSLTLLGYVGDWYTVGTAWQNVPTSPWGGETEANSEVANSTCDASVTKRANKADVSVGFVEANYVTLNKLAATQDNGTPILSLYVLFDWDTTIRVFDPCTPCQDETCHYNDIYTTFVGTFEFIFSDGVSTTEKFTLDAQSMIEGSDLIDGDLRYLHDVDPYDDCILDPDRADDDSYIGFLIDGCAIAKWLDDGGDGDFDRDESIYFQHIRIKDITFTWQRGASVPDLAADERAAIRIDNGTGAWVSLSDDE